MNELSLNRLLQAVLAVTLTLSFCTLLRADDADSAEVLAASAKEVFRVHCAECHTGDNARSGVEILDHEGLIDNEYVVADKPDDSVVYQLITSTGDDVMPPSNRPTLNENEITTIREWIVAGAVAFPVDVDASAGAELSADDGDTEMEAESKSNSKAPADADEVEPKEAEVKPTAKQSAPIDPAALEAEILDEILNYVRQSTEAERAYLRFFSVRHLVASGVTQQRIDQHRNALAKTINHLSHEPQLVTPTAIDSA